MPNKTQGFLMSSNVKQLQVSSGFGVPSEPFVLPHAPAIATIASASSAARALFNQPTVQYEFMHKVLDVDFETFASCQVDGTDGMMAYLTSEASADLKFGTTDGGYADNSGISFTIAKMQQDCAAGLLDCSGPLKILHADAPGGSDYPKLFTNFSIPVPNEVVTGHMGMLTPVIFAESFSSLKWTPLSTPIKISSKLFLKQFVRGAGFPDLVLNITYYQGTLTTVDNTWFGVKGGTSVDVLLFNVDYGALKWVPAAGTGKCPMGSTLCLLEKAFFATDLEYNKNMVYADIDWVPHYVNAFAEAMAPKVMAFLA